MTFRFKLFKTIYMKDLTLIIPAKKESRSLPKVLEELKKYNLKTKIILSSDDLDTINSISKFNIEIIYQKNKGYGDALITGINSLNDVYFVFLMQMDPLIQMN